MKRYAPFLLSNLFVLATLALSAAPVLAQPAERPSPNLGGDYGPMWGGAGWHSGMGITGALMMTLTVIIVIALIVWLVRSTHQQGYGHGPYSGHRGQHGSALDILAERFARGEIDKQEFEDKRRTLGR